MATAVECQDPQELVRQGLLTLQHQTGACLVGYLSLDPTDPPPKMVLPETAEVDVHLSRLADTADLRWAKANPSGWGDSRRPDRPARA